MMGLDATRLRAVIGKELRDYRRKRSIVAAMIILPLVFLVEPVVAIFAVSSTTADLDHYVVLPLLYMLLLPVIMPSTLAAYSVAGEREQGTLEPLLTTPIRREEFILGKATAIMIPTLALTYVVFGLFLLAVRLFAIAPMSAAVFRQGPVLLAMFLFAPLVAGWAIVIGMVISVRANEIRVAQQLGMLASFPPLGVIVLLVTGVIQPTFIAAVLSAVGLLIADLLALRIASGVFNRERLVTGTKAVRS